MKIQSIFAATCCAFVLSMAGTVSARDGKSETVNKNFEAAIPNIPGKSLIAVAVDTRRVRTLRPTSTRSRLSSMPT